MNQSANIDLIPKFAAVENIYFSQYDVGRTVIINLVENATDYEIPTGATVKIQATKPSGLGFSVDCTFSGNAVTVVSTAEMTDEAGQFPCELKITNGTTILGTANFTFNVERSPHPEGTTDGTAETVVSEITVALNNALEEIEESGGLTQGIKNAFLRCFENVMWTSEDGKNAYDNLAEAFGGTYNISYNLVNCLSSNTVQSLVHGSNYATMLTTKSGNPVSFGSVTVEMGGVDVTETVYARGLIAIPSVTGDIVITAVLAEGYTLYEYIGQTGIIPQNGGIITDISYSTSHSLETAISFNMNSGTFQPFMGIRRGVSGSKEIAIFVQPNSTKLGYWFDGTDTVADITNLMPNTRNTISFQPVGNSETYPNRATITVNGVEYDSGSSSSAFTTDSWFTLFGYGTQAGVSVVLSYINARIGETFITNGNGEYVHFLAPANNGSVNGFYDLVTDRFYTGADPSLFECGNWEE